MKFQYLKDPLFLFVFVLYFVNRFLIKKLVVGGFFHNHLNDLICISFWVPIMLFLMRKLGLRNDDAPPRLDELLIPLILWSVVFELILPQMNLFNGLSIADYLDIFYYALGTLGAMIFWKYRYKYYPILHIDPATSRYTD